MGDVVEEPGLVSLPDGDSGSAEDAAHGVWLSEHVEYHVISSKVQIRLQ